MATTFQFGETLVFSCDACPVTAYPTRGEATAVFATAPERRDDASTVPISGKRPIVAVDGAVLVIVR